MQVISVCRGTFLGVCAALEFSLQNHVASFLLLMCFAQSLSLLFPFLFWFCSLVVDTQVVEDCMACIDFAVYLILVAKVIKSL